MLTGDRGWWNAAKICSGCKECYMLGSPALQPWRQGRRWVLQDHAGVGRSQRIWAGAQRRGVGPVDLACARAASAHSPGHEAGGSSSSSALPFSQARWTSPLWTSSSLSDEGIVLDNLSGLLSTNLLCRAGYIIWRFQCTMEMQGPCLKIRAKSVKGPKI